MQYGIMLIAKYWNKLFKIYSLCGAGECCGILICSVLRYSTCCSPWYSPVECMNALQKLGWGHAADLSHICFPPQSNFYHWEGQDDWQKSILLSILISGKKQTSVISFIIRNTHTQTHTLIHTNKQTCTHATIIASLSISKHNQWLTLLSLLLMSYGGRIGMSWLQCAPIVLSWKMPKRLQWRQSFTCISARSGTLCDLSFAAVEQSR